MTIYARINTSNDVITYPVFKKDLRVRFPHIITKDYGERFEAVNPNTKANEIYVAVEVLEKPDSLSSIYEEATPVLEEGSWKQAWEMRSLTDEEAAEKEEIKTNYLANYRYEVENGGIDVNGTNVLTDQATRSNLIATRILAKEDSNYTAKWKTPDGFVELNAAQIIGIADAVRDHVQNCFDAEATVLENLSTYTTESQIAAAFDAAYEEA